MSRLQREKTDEEWLSQNEYRDNRHGTSIKVCCMVQLAEYDVSVDTNPRCRWCVNQDWCRQSDAQRTAMRDAMASPIRKIKERYKHRKDSKATQAMVAREIAKEAKRMKKAGTLPEFDELEDPDK